MSTIIVFILLAIITGCVIYKMVKDKRNGKGCCNGSCCNCGSKCNEYKEK